MIKESKKKKYSINAFIDKNKKNSFLIVVDENFVHVSYLFM